MINRAGQVVNDGLPPEVGPLGVVAGVDFPASLTNVTAWGGQAPLYQRAVGAGLGAVEGAVDRQLALTVGSVAGWRSGVLDLRIDALQRLQDLLDRRQTRLAGAVVGLPSGAVRSFLQVQQRNPLGWPLFSPPDAVARVGGFRGLGGPWLSPPRSLWRTPDGTLTVRCRDDSGWRLEADVFGSRVTPLDTGAEADGDPIETGVQLSPGSYLITLTGELG